MKRSRSNLRHLVTLIEGGYGGSPYWKYLKRINERTQWVCSRNSLSDLPKIRAQGGEISGKSERELSLQHKGEKQKEGISDGRAPGCRHRRVKRTKGFENTPEDFPFAPKLQSHCPDLSMDVEVCELVQGLLELGGVGFHQPIDRDKEEKTGFHLTICQERTEKRKTGSIPVRPQ